MPARCTKAGARRSPPARKSSEAPMQKPVLAARGLPPGPAPQLMDVSAFRGNGTKLLTVALPTGLLDFHLVAADRVAYRLDVLGALRPDHHFLAQAGALL